MKETAIVGAGVLSAGALAACSKAGADTDNVKWDKEVDVVCVGSSGAAWGALAAKDAGASAIIIEKAKMFGGTTSLSGGGHWIPNSYCSKAAFSDYDDSIEACTTYVNYISEEKAIPELLESYLTNGPKFLEWSRDKLKFEWIPFYGGAMVQDYYSKAPEYRSRGRGVQVDDVASMKSIMGQSDYKNPTPGLYAAVEFQLVKHLCDQQEIEIMLETEATKLIQDGSGAVIGLVAKASGGTEINIKANKGVILGTGGFDYNNDMRNRFLYHKIHASVALATNTGDGHRMGMEIGADVAFLAENYGAGTFLPDGPASDGSIPSDSGFKIVDSWGWRGNPGAIVVNKRGKRFADESTAYPVFGRSMSEYDTDTFAWMNNPGYFICDSSYVAHYGLPPMSGLPGADTSEKKAPDWFPRADTIEGLAEKLGIDPAALSAEVAEFNKNAANGVDPVWHRGEYDFDRTTTGDSTRATELKNKCLAPLTTPPFYGAPYYLGSLSTAGGLLINGKAQVVHVGGKPIPGLYACGCTAASPFGGAYPGGGAPVGATCVMGWVAGTDAAKRDISA